MQEVAEVSETSAHAEPADHAEPAEHAEPAVHAEAAEEDDPVAALKADLRSKPGDWYVIHSYAGYENKVKANLETRVQNLDVGDYIFQVEGAHRRGHRDQETAQRKQVNRKVLPGYILVRMDLTDDSWSAVRNTPGVTGFVRRDFSPFGACTRRCGENSCCRRVRRRSPPKVRPVPRRPPSRAAWSARSSRSITRWASR